MRGLFIVLEGIDGAGTTTQTRRLAEWMSAHALAHHVTREPSDRPVGRLIRSYLTGDGSVDKRALALLFAADRIDHFAEEIAPALARGVHVVCDRYVLSSLAYQSLDLPIADVAKYNASAHPPDLTLLLDLPVEEAERRRGARGGPAELFDARALQTRIAENYLRLGKQHKSEGVPIVILDGAQPPDTVAQEIARAVESCLARASSPS